MGRKSPNDKASTPHDRRRQGTERRLRAALERLASGSPNHSSLRGRPYRLTVVTLAREARVARNTIYTNHRSILGELNRGSHQGAPPTRPGPEQRMAELGALIEQLQQQKRQIVTENAALLKRAIDAEKIVDRLKKQNIELVQELAVARQPIGIPRRRT